MKRRTKKKILKQFCQMFAVKAEFFYTVGARNARELRRLLESQLDDAMEYYYGRGF